jgi:two-component system chemotaxis sensor kinase CheA
VKINAPGDIFRSIFLGKQYTKLIEIDDQVRYLSINFVFMLASVILASLGYTVIGSENVRAIIDFGFAFALILCIILMRINVPFKYIPIIPVSLVGLYFLYLLYRGSYDLWIAVWLFAYPPIAIFLCKMVLGLVQSIVALTGIIVLLFSPIGGLTLFPEIKIRFLAAYILIMGVTILYEWLSILKNRKERILNIQLAQDKDIIQRMKDNINQGIFLMDTELRILPEYSKPLVTILSYYDSELGGKNFLDLLSASLDVKQLQTMKGYFNMVFAKAKSVKVLESANPISEFEYKVEDRTKTLTTRFNLIEQQGSEPLIIGIIQDITREKEFQRDLQAQKEAQEAGMRDIFDVIQIDPLVFQDFIEDTESNFNFINAILKDRSLTEKQVLNKFFQNVHAMKSNSLILGLQTFGKKLHDLEDDIKHMSDLDKIMVEDVLGLAIKLETIMKEKDEFAKITKKIEAFKASNQMDSVLIHSLTKAVEKVSEETRKKVEIKSGHVDLSILETKLRKPIKDILFQCVRNSIYHGIEPVDERIQKQKKPTSLLVFSIKKVDGKAEITFSDDGRGLDWEKIKARYLTLHPDTVEVNKKILLSAIFMPEFSTSEETNMVAGRGVGLSLVKDLVKENNGTIKVDSSDSGLTLKFFFPLAS